MKKIDFRLIRLMGIVIVAAVMQLLLLSCSGKETVTANKVKILFLHHSTGEVIWKGGSGAVDVKGIRIGEKYDVPKWFENYNSVKGTSYEIQARNFPNQKPYGWKNYPFDYYNLWVKNAGAEPFMEEPTLEILTKEYNVIIFKHCYPVTLLDSDSVNTSIDSETKTIENYKLQYQALKQKMLQFPDTKFIIWTGAVMVQAQMSEQNAENAQAFFNWVRTTWDTDGDNIFLWDFYTLETEGGLYLKPEHATAANNSHPNSTFAEKVAPFFCQRIVDVIENNGNKTTLTGTYR